MPFNRPIPDSTQRPRHVNALSSLVQAEKMVQISILLPSSAFIGWLLGAWLDSHLHQHWITLAGIIFGGFAGLIYVIRLVVAAGATAQKSDSAAASEPEAPKKEND